jgi:hypothetical protein
MTILTIVDVTRRQHFTIDNDTGERTELGWTKQVEKKYKKVMNKEQQQEKWKDIGELNDTN